MSANIPQGIGFRALIYARAKYRTISRDLTNIRNQVNMPSEILARVQGFELSAREVNRGGVSRFQIVRLDVGSSPTSIQVSRRAFLDPAIHAQMIAAVHGAIDPTLQGYREIGTQGLAQMMAEAPGTHRELVHKCLSG